jgi:hypothetical protein
MGPKRPIIAMTVKVFFQEEEEEDTLRSPWGLLDSPDTLLDIRIVLANIAHVGSPFCCLFIFVLY